MKIKETKSRNPRPKREVRNLNGAFWSDIMPCYSLRKNRDREYARAHPSNVVLSTQTLFSKNQKDVLGYISKGADGICFGQRVYKRTSIGKEFKTLKEARAWVVEK